MERGARDMALSQSIFFNFMQFSGENAKIIGWRLFAVKPL